MRKNRIGNFILLFGIIFLIYLVMQNHTSELPLQEETLPYVESAKSSQFYYQQLNEDQKKIYDILKYDIQVIRFS